MIPRRRTRPAACAALLACLLTASCSGDGSPTDTAEGPAIGVRVAASTLRLPGSNTTTYTVSRHGGFDGLITLTVTGLPTGVAANIQPNPVPSQVTQGFLQFFGQSQTPSGTYDLIIRANAEGVEEARAGLRLVVD